ncbi:MAG TPA: hypothetical protein VFN62_08050 [Acidobacteriaceae bacterium]|nr:hypothetical protein [Acidobacteriaceae bacterium]
MNIRLHLAHPRRVGLAFLALGILGTLARNYVGPLKAIEHGNVADFTLGLLLGLGIALCFLTDSDESEESPNSILPS